ncbi:oligogalacturonate-specific porin KdgM family protein, partial [Vibrio sp. 10N.222.51.A6]
EWDLGVKIGYKFDNLRPYVEFWTSDYGSAEESERQLKTRVGVTYSF